MNSDLLCVRGLRTAVVQGGRSRDVVQGVGFSLQCGQILAVIGESGAGKSLLASSLIRLAPSPQVRFLDGEVWLGETDLAGLGEKDLRAIRGRRIAMMFQDSAKSLHPRVPGLEQIHAVLRTHQTLSAPAAQHRAEEWLAGFGFLPANFVNRYPHELSGGMQQAVYLAMVLSSSAPLLLLDEPTTAFDALTRQRVVETLLRERTRNGRSLILITHDIALASRIADRLLVMYGGMAVEQLSPSNLRAAAHPYLRQLVQCTLALSPAVGSLQTQTWEKGGIGETGCPYHLRCPRAIPRCRAEPPGLQNRGDDHWFACHNPLPPP